MDLVFLVIFYCTYLNKVTEFLKSQKYYYGVVEIVLLEYILTKIY